jgi:hypothetical protein
LLIGFALSATLTKVFIGEEFKIFALTVGAPGSIWRRKIISAKRVYRILMQLIIEASAQTNYGGRYGSVNRQNARNF